MTTLNVQAVITAVDRLTPALATMGGRVAAMQSRFTGAAAAASSFGQGAGIAAAGLIAATTAGQAELDRALRQFQVVGTATADQRGQMRALANEVGVKLGLPQLELIEGATELLQAGLTTEDLLGKGADGVTMLQDMAQAALVAGDSISSMSKDLVILAKAFNLPWATGEDRIATMRKLQGLAIVAPRYSPDTPTEHIRALAEFGAIAAQLGISPNEASALQNTLSSAGFTGSRGGMALKTILQRILNPTPAAMAQMTAAGFNYGSVFKTDLSGLTADTFINTLGMGGVHAEKARSAINKRIQAGLAQGDGLDLLRWKAGLEDAISSSLGLKKGDAQNRRIIKKSIDNITATKSGGMNVVAFLEELGKMPVAAFKDLVGLHHATKGAVLKFQESLRQYKDNLARSEKEAPGAVNEGLRIKLEGFDRQLRRVSAAWTHFKDSLSTTGTFGAVLDKIRETLERLSGMDPRNLDMLSKGITGLSLGLAGLAAGSAGVWLLAKLGAVMTGPLGKFIAAGGIATLFGGLDPQQFNVNGAIQGTVPLIELIQQATGLAGDLVGLLDDVGRSALALGGVDIAGSVLVSSLMLMSATLRDIRGVIEYLRGGGSFTNPDKDWGIGDFLRPFDVEAYARKKRGDPVPPASGLDLWSPLPNQAVPPVSGWFDRFKSWWGGDQSMSGGGLDTSAVVQRLDSPLQVIMSEPPVAKLEGSGSVTVNVKVDGGQVTGVSAADDGKNISLKTGDSMPDTNR